MLEEAFGLLIEDVEAVPCPCQADVAAHDAYVCLHNLVHLFGALRDEDSFLGRDSALIVPLGHVLVEVVTVDDFKRMTGSRVSIDHRLDE